MRYISLIFIIYLLAFLQSILIIISPFSSVYIPELVLPIIIFLGLIDVETGIGVIISFISGYFVDSFSAGSPMYLFSFIYVVLFLVFKLIGSRFYLFGFIAHISLSFLGCLTANLLILFFRSIFERSIPDFMLIIKILFVKSIITAIVTPLIFNIVKRLEIRYRIFKREGNKVKL